MTTLFKARVTYGVVVALALTVGYTLSSVLIQDNLEKHGKLAPEKHSKVTSNNYYRLMVCKSASYDLDYESCIRMFA